MRTGADLICPGCGNSPSLVTNLDDILEVVDALDFVLAQILDDYTFGWIFHNL